MLMKVNKQKLEALGICLLTFRNFENKLFNRNQFKNIARDFLRGVNRYEKKTALSDVMGIYDLIQFKLSDFAEESNEK